MQQRPLAIPHKDYSLPISPSISISMFISLFSLTLSVSLSLFQSMIMADNILPHCLTFAEGCGSSGAGTTEMECSTISSFGPAATPRHTSSTSLHSTRLSCSPPRCLRGFWEALAVRQLPQRASQPVGRPCYTLWDGLSCPLHQPPS